MPMVRGLLKPLVTSRSKRARLGLGKNCFAIAFLVVMNSSYAVDYGSVTENAVVLYNKPSIESKKLYVVSRYMPLEQAVSLENWVKVRDSSGNMAWIEKRFLSSKRFVITTDAQVAIHQSPEEKSAVVAQVKKQVALELLGTTDTGWLKIRHIDGATGFVKAAQIWGE
jgi:SH3-like domain-containing protein